MADHVHSWRPNNREPGTVPTDDCPSCGAVRPVGTLLAAGEDRARDARRRVYAEDRRRAAARALDSYLSVLYGTPRESWTAEATGAAEGFVEAVGDYVIQRIAATGGLQHSGDYGVSPGYVCAKFVPFDLGAPEHGTCGGCGARYAEHRSPDYGVPTRDADGRARYSWGRSAPAPAAKSSAEGPELAPLDGKICCRSCGMEDGLAPGDACSLCGWVAPAAPACGVTDASAVHVPHIHLDDGVIEPRPCPEVGCHTLNGGRCTFCGGQPCRVVLVPPWPVNQRWCSCITGNTATDMHPYGVDGCRYGPSEGASEMPRVEGPS